MQPGCAHRASHQHLLNIRTTLSHLEQQAPPFVESHSSLAVNTPARGLAMQSGLQLSPGSTGMSQASAVQLQHQLNTLSGKGRVAQSEPVQDHAVWLMQSTTGLSRHQTLSEPCCRTSLPLWRRIIKLSMPAWDMHANANRERGICQQRSAGHHKETACG